MSNETKPPSPLAPPKRRKGRSPGYPAINLEEAVQRARQLYGAEQRHTAHFSTIVKHWGYSPKSGPARLVFAALIKFGLLDVSGENDARAAKVSDLAVSIILDNRPDSEERKTRLQDAAMRPTIHRTLWTKYGGSLPSDTELEFQLPKNFGFTEVGTKDFLKQFRETIAFAKMDSSTIIAGDSNDSNDDCDDEIDESEKPMDSTNATNRSAISGATIPINLVRKDSLPQAGKSLMLPLISGGTAELRVPYLLEPEDLEWMETMLQKLKRSILRAPAFMVGDAVQRLSNNQDQFPSPRKIKSIQGGYAFFEGSDTGVSLEELRRV